MTKSEGEIGPRRRLYGLDPSQFGDLHLPSGQRRPGTVVLIHGGWWGPNFGADRLDGVAADLAQRGWVTWNIEYRRVGLGGGYPSTLDDVAAAIDFLGALEEVDHEPVVAIGHSAGGHLAVWAAGRGKLAPGAPGARPVVEVTGAISLAGAVDLGSAAREKIGDEAAIKLMGGGPEEHPKWYEVADPMTQIPIRAAIRCVHARSDDRVPFAQSVSYVAAARAVGEDAQLLEVEGDHISVVDTSASSWPVIIGALEELMTTS
jgi:acetyl esterase/lipase